MERWKGNRRDNERLGRELFGGLDQDREVAASLFSGAEWRRPMMLQRSGDWAERTGLRLQLSLVSSASVDPKEARLSSRRDGMWNQALS